jgi:hypothetical protein
MIITKEKGVLVFAILVVVYASVSTLSNYKPPPTVLPPEDSEAARRWDPDDELVPELAVKDSWERGGRNPFLIRESYAEQAPVPLSLPPGLDFIEFVPGMKIDRQFDSGDALQYTPPPIDPEPKVDEPDDSLPKDE